MSVEIARRSFTVEEYRRMGEIGILSEDDRVELVGGEIVEMNPIGSRHAACVGRLTKLCERSAGDVSIVWVQNPVHVNDYSEPVPDVTLLKRRDDFYAQANPGPEDVLLLIEVSDTTLEYDRRIKVPLYARAGVPEVWIVNLAEERVEVFADPSGGAYQTTAVFSRGEEVRSRTLAALRLDVSEIFG